MQIAEQIGEPEDRRRYPRVKARIPVELRSNVATVPMRTATDEISLCGCYIESMFTMEIGTRLELVFSLAETKITGVGIVATKYPQVGNGIDFVNMTPEDRLKLHAFILELDQKANHT
jgi:c-di-GMP-binding flagellar brake protein YcgR